MKNNPKTFRETENPKPHNPNFVIVSDYDNPAKTFKTKMDAIRAYSTQFHNPQSSEPETFISQPKFLNFIEARAKYFGFKIDKDYGEAFFCEEEIELNLINLLKNTEKE